MPSACPNCAADLTAEALLCSACGVVLRLAGAPAEEAPPGLPFQDPRTPLWAGALQTWAAVATDPVGAFTRLDPGDVLARGLLHLASTAATALALCSALLLVLVLTYAPDVDIYIGFWLVLVAPTALQVGAAAFLVLPLHVACVLWGAASRGLDATFGTWCAAQGPVALVASPVFMLTVIFRGRVQLVAGSLLGLLVLCLATLLTLGLARTHRVPTWRAAAAVTTASFVPPLLTHLLVAVTAVT